MRWIVRAPTFAEVEVLYGRALSCFKCAGSRVLSFSLTLRRAAALAAACRIEISKDQALFELVQNEALGVSSRLPVHPTLSEQRATSLRSRRSTTASRRRPRSRAPSAARRTLCVACMHCCTADGSRRATSRTVRTPQSVLVPTLNAPRRAARAASQLRCECRRCTFPADALLAIPTEPNGGNHTPAFTASARTKAAHEAAMVVTRSLALVGWRVLTDDAFYAGVRARSLRCRGEP